MEIHRVGVSVPLSETPTESVVPKDPPLPPAISQPFQEDAIVSGTPPTLDLGSAGSSRTTPLGGQSGPLRENTLENPPGEDPSLVEEFRQRLIQNVLETKRESVKGTINNIR